MPRPITIVGRDRHIPTRADSRRQPTTPLPGSTALSVSSHRDHFALWQQGFDLSRSRRPGGLAGQRLSPTSIKRVGIAETLYSLPLFLPRGPRTIYVAGGPQPICWTTLLSFAVDRIRVSTTKRGGLVLCASKAAGGFDR